jgi:hypothetical protein
MFIKILCHYVGQFKKCIDLGSQEQKNKLVKLGSNCSNLISEQPGNYAIKIIVDLNTKIINQKFYQFLKNNLCSICKEKYVSNAIEKFLTNILLKSEKILHELIIDKFNNFLVQRIFVLFEGEKVLHYYII